MNFLFNKEHVSTIRDYMDAYVSKKPEDCILYSEDGSQFKIHKEVFGQTKFMRQILTSVAGHCCSMIEIFCPCIKEDLRHLVQCLYVGKIHCDSVAEFLLITFSKFLVFQKICICNVEKRF